jgi:hypothetical protein
MWLLPGVVDAFMWPVYQLLGLAQAVVAPLALPGGWPT